MTKITYFILLLCCSIYYSFGQVGIGTTTPDASSILDVTSTTQGFLPPRMTEVQRDAIASPARGLLIFNMDSNCFQFYTGAAWSDCLGAGSVSQNKLDCGSISLNGAYMVGTPFNGTNTITIDVVINTYDTYNITTNSANGYSFSASGSFASLGVHTITLTGTGTPLAAQTDTFTISLNGSGTTCNIDITATSGYLANCLEYFNGGYKTDGIYTIDPDGIGGNSPYDCYCDMTNNGGGWTLVFNHIVSGFSGFWANENEAREHNIASPGLTTNKYSILNKLDEVKSGAAYEFRLHYPSLGLTNHWSQTFDPRSGRSPSNPVPGYTEFYADMSDNNWGGLEWDEDTYGQSYLMGSLGYPSYDPYYTIGALYTAIRADNTTTDRVQLFIR
ncbi:fibrinogen-like YCDxxxxGGGW domain-containing protein [Flavivirga eckloniae]|uniref:Fibrinogen C-terminal domain-containing protein n=1 Tax=Flavivirga eckloniae TaxID=1803846 RepID=A0A2K9PM37_9FLAO|nr:fibrinogen-like YCDxxxxGGGW domain-containing protein [Flavivirga eckloniae]AUP78131.1 hypothetical protein C1H87_05120 [Flavivirga eckloniae]